MIPWRKLAFWIAILPSFVLGLAAGGAAIYLWPKFTSFALTQLREQSEAHSPARIQAEKVTLSLLPLGIRLHKVQVRAKNPAQLGFTEAQIPRVNVGLDFFQFLSGRISLSTIEIEDLDLSVNAESIQLLQQKPKSHSSSMVPDFAALYAILQQLPLRELHLVRARLHAQWKDWNLETRGDWRLELARRHMDAEVELPFVEFSHPSFQQRGDFSLQARLTDGGLAVQLLELKLGMGKVVTKAKIERGTNSEGSSRGSLETEVSLDLSLVPPGLLSFFRIPALKGTTALESKISWQPKTEPKWSIGFSGNELAVGKVGIGKLSWQSQAQGGDIRFDNFQLVNAAGGASLKDARLKWERSDDSSWGSLSVEAELKAEEIDLHELLAQLGVGDVPLELFINGALGCKGPILPQPRVNCSGSLEGEHLEVRTGEGIRNTIVQLRKFTTKGSVIVDSQAVTYDTGIELDSTTGKSQGRIAFSEGFQIQYQSDNLDFSSLEWLSGLKLQGKGKVNGSTSGNSKAAKFDLDIATESLWFQDYFLGKTSGKIGYQAGLLYFRDLNTAIGGSRAKSKVELRLREADPKSRLSIETKISPLDLMDVGLVLGRVAPEIPALSGIGQAEFQGNGPLRVQDLDFRISAQADKGQVGIETFEQLELQAQRKSKVLQLLKFQLSKGGVPVSAVGVMLANGEMDFQVSTQNFPLEASETISGTSRNLSGLLTSQIGITGRLPAPDISAGIALRQVLLGEEEIPDSKAKLQFNSQTLAGDFVLFGGQLTGAFQWPMKEDQRFFIRTKANRWSFASLLSLLGGGRLIQDYQTELTADVDLEADRGGIFSSSGKIRVQKLFLQRGDLTLAHSLPMQASLQKGRAELDGFTLTGTAGETSLRSASFSREDARLGVTADLNLRLLQLFVPFLEDLGGRLQLNVNTSGPLVSPSVLGSAKVSAGFFKLRGLTQHFEGLQTTADFSQKRISIREIRGRFAGGSLTGEGEIQIEGPKRIPVQVQLRVENASVLAPEGIRTQGSANLEFTGTWFPYVLRGQYDVLGGLVQIEPGGEGSGPNRRGQVRASTYLPRLITQQGFSPVLLDLNVNLARPLDVRNSLVEGKVTGALRVEGAPEAPTLRGKITMEKGTQILFRDRRFEVLAGELSFVPAPGPINPGLYLSARSRVADYDVNLLIQGTSQSLVPTLSSVPPLAQSDIVSLLALGVVTPTASTSPRATSAGQGADDARMQAAQLSVGTAILSNTIAKPLKDNLGIQLQVSSSYDDTKNVAVQRLTVSRDLGKRLNASASQLRGQQSSTEVRLKYLLNQNLSAVGSWENREPSEAVQRTLDAPRRSESIFGLDLEFRQEFR